MHTQTSRHYVLHDVSLNSRLRFRSFRSGGGGFIGLQLTGYDPEFENPNLQGVRYSSYKFMA